MNRPVVLLHASASSSRQWSALAGQIGRDVHAPDLAGHGTRLGEVLAPATLREEAAPIERLLERLGGALLVGHSYGGAVALDIARRRPQLVHALAVHEPPLLALLGRDPGSQREWTTVTAAFARMQDCAHRGDLQGAASHFIDLWCGEGSWAATLPARRPGIAACMPAVLRHQSPAVFADPLALDDLIRMPPLLLTVGRHTVPAARRIVELLRRTPSRGVPLRVEPLEGAGHMAPITHAADFNRRVLRFLSSQAPVGADSSALTTHLWSYA